MTIKELRELTTEELRDKLSGLRKELIDLEFKIRTAQESDTSSSRKVKKDIARMLTIINEKFVEGNVMGIVGKKQELEEKKEVKSESDK